MQGGQSGYSLAHNIFTPEMRFKHFLDNFKCTLLASNKIWRWRHQCFTCPLKKIYISCVKKTCLSFLMFTRLPQDSACIVCQYDLLIKEGFMWRTAPNAIFYDCTVLLTPFVVTSGVTLTESNTEVASSLPLLITTITKTNMEILQTI